MTNESDIGTHYISLVLECADLLRPGKNLSSLVVLNVHVLPATPVVTQNYTKVNSTLVFESKIKEIKNLTAIIAFITDRGQVNIKFSEPIRNFSYWNVTPADIDIQLTPSYELEPHERGLLDFNWTIVDI